MTTAYVVHQLPGRLRLRISEHHKDESWFAHLADRLRQQDAIDTVSKDALTATVLIRHGLDDEDIRNLLATDFGLTLEQAPPRKPLYGLAPVGVAVNTADQAIRRVSGGAGDLRVVLFLLFMALALRQLVKGDVMAPAISLVWYAFDLALHTQRLRNDSQEPT